MLPRSHCATLQLVIDTMLNVSHSSKWIGTVAMLLGCAVVNGKSADMAVPCVVEDLMKVMLRNWAGGLATNIA